MALVIMDMFKEQNYNGIANLCVQNYYAIVIDE